MEYVSHRVFELRNLDALLCDFQPVCAIFNSFLVFNCFFFPRVKPWGKLGKREKGEYWLSPMQLMLLKGELRRCQPITVRDRTRPGPRVTRVMSLLDEAEKFAGVFFFPLLLGLKATLVQLQSCRRVPM